MKTTVKQVETFTRLIGLCAENGSMYNPAKESITIDALQALLAKAHQKHQMVNDTHHQLRSAINTRDDAAHEMQLRATRAANAATVLITQPGLLEDIKMTLSKIRGYRRGAVHGKEQPDEGSPPGEYRKPRGPVAYLTISSKIDHFEQLIRCLETPEYKPNEEEITVEGMKAFFASLEAKQAKLLRSWSMHRVAMDQYRSIIQSGEGIYGVSKTVKAYMKSVYGASSHTFKIVSKLKFRTW